MADKTTFWKGVSAGLLAGMGIAAVLRYLPVEKLITRSSTAPEPGTPAFALETVPEEPVSQEDSEAASIAIASFFSKRSQSEPAGADRAHEPVAFATDGSGSAATFLRTDVAKGDRLEVEFFEIPGRPGRRIDHIDLSMPVRVYPRSLDMGSSG